MEILRQDNLAIHGGTIPITLSKIGKKYRVDIDGVEWFCIENQNHAVILYQMMLEHITEYMHYEKL